MNEIKIRTSAKNFGEYLSFLRRCAQKSLRQVEQISGISNSYLSKLEKGQKEAPKPDTLMRLSAALKTPYKELMDFAGYNGSYLGTDAAVDMFEYYENEYLSEWAVEYERKGLKESDMIEEMLCIPESLYKYFHDNYELPETLLDKMATAANTTRFGLMEDAGLMDEYFAESYGPVWNHFMELCDYDTEEASRRYDAFKKAEAEDAQRDSALHRHESPLPDGTMYVKEEPSNYYVSSTPGPIKRDGMILEPVQYKKKIPVLGRISAGMPLTAVENIESYENVTDDAIDYALVVKGDSMINARIFEGDIVYVTKDADYENGDIVIALINGDDATIKRFYKYGDEVILRPENPTMKEMHFPAADVQLIGKVKEVRFKI